jgi:hypothetical protein
MSFQSRRLTVVAALLMVALLAQWGLSWMPERVTLVEANPAETAEVSYRFTVDTEGWGRTSKQSMAMSRYNLSLKGQFASVPMQLGEWRGLDVASNGTDLLGFVSPQHLFRLYTNSSGRSLWLRLLATSDWQLFYHTPPICYAGNNWQVESESSLALSNGSTAIPVHAFDAHQGSANHRVLYTFLWPSRFRDMSEGATMVELVAPFAGTQNEDQNQSRDRAQRDLEEFTRLLFTQVPGVGVAEIPPMQHRLDANFQDKLVLLGYDLNAESLKPGEPLEVTLYWRVTAAVERNYTLFVHVLQNGGRTGAFLAQKDTLPFDGMYPTSAWRPGEVLKETYQLRIPEDAKRGQRELEMGLYEVANGQRMNVLGWFGRRVGDSVKLAPVFVDGPVW